MGLREASGKPSLSREHFNNPMNFLEFFFDALCLCYVMSELYFCIYNFCTFTWDITCLEWCEAKRRFITIALECDMRKVKKLRGVHTEWGTPTFDLCWCKFTGRKQIKTHEVCWMLAERRAIALVMEAAVHAPQNVGKLPADCTAPQPKRQLLRTRCHENLRRHWGRQIAWMDRLHFPAVGMWSLWRSFRSGRWPSAL